ncbi:DNA polymerase II large subunit [Labeo rohita]|uniref:DNA polymerase II large subunit n=1 Tax=Labeo rohita TaxID=84645 RepID=A0ABQ8L3A5_LABRO|nr:DNA polymerase II large subunit [Labeo rohita]
MKRGVPLGMVCRRKVVTTEASNTGWGALFNGKPAFGLWSKAEEGIHINCLETLAVCRAYQFFLPDLKGHDVLVSSDSMTVVYYIKSPGRTFLKAPLHSGGGPSGQLPLWGVDTSPTDGPENLGNLWEGRGRPLHLRRQLDPSSDRASQGTETQASSGGPSLEKSTLVLGAVPAAPLSGEWDDMAPPAQAMGPVSLASGRESVNLPEGVLNTISQARASSTRHLYALKWRLNPPRPLTIPTWDHTTVLRALKGPPFEQLLGSDLRPLTFKPALLLALASVKRMGDLQALSVNPSCLKFRPGDSKVILKLRHGYVPKVPSTPFQGQVITLSALPSSDEDQELN